MYVCECFYFIAYAEFASQSKTISKWANWEASNGEIEVGDGIQGLSCIS